MDSVPKAGDTREILDQLITMEERARLTQKDVLGSIEKRYKVT